MQERLDLETRIDEQLGQELQRIDTLRRLYPDDIGSIKKSTSEEAGRILKLLDDNMADSDILAVIDREAIAFREALNDTNLTESMKNAVVSILKKQVRAEVNHIYNRHLSLF